MRYFIDHLRKSVHSQKFAGDACGFISTPVNYREFTNCPSYIDRLLTEKGYSQCTECLTAPTHFSKQPDVSK